MSKSKGIIHGERNKDLCEDLLSGKKYYDWVITTAFYSSIHLLEDKILPTEINGQKCGNIAEVRRAYNLKGRHVARETLVQDKTDIKTSIRYKWLDDKSRYSRYITYKVTPTEASKAQQYIQDIYNYCCFK